MRIRKQDANSDYQFGHGATDFYVNEPAAPALLVKYRLTLNQGSFWLDLSAGVPYQTRIIGFGTSSTRDPVLRATILGTQGVSSLANYSSNLNRSTRAFSVNANVNTIYGKYPAPIQTQIQQGA